MKTLTTSTLSFTKPKKKTSSLWSNKITCNDKFNSFQAIVFLLNQVNLRGGQEKKTIIKKNQNTIYLRLTTKWLIVIIQTTK